MAIYTFSYNQIEFPDVFLQRYASVDSSALKVAIYLMSVGSADDNAIASDLGIPISSVSRSIDLWKTAGLINSDRQEKKTSVESIKKAKRHLTHEEIALSVLGNPEIAVLLQESQRILGRELSVSESRLLIETLQESNLSVSLILLAESFWHDVVHSPKMLNETAKTVRTWAKDGILSQEDAEREISIMERRINIINDVAKLLKINTSDFSNKDKKLIYKIYEDYAYDEAFISEVLLRKPDANIPYIAAVLSDWHKKGYKTISDTRLLSPAGSVVTSNSTDDGHSLFKKAVRKNRKE